jgi:hypothetical protein
VYRFRLQHNSNRTQNLLYFLAETSFEIFKKRVDESPIPHKQLARQELTEAEIAEIGLGEASAGEEYCEGPFVAIREALGQRQVAVLTDHLRSDDAPKIETRLWPQPGETTARADDR